MDIKKFCGSSKYRSWMNAPFNLNGRTVATNGHILISVPEIEGTEPFNDPGKEGIAKVLDLIASADFAPMPKIDYPDSHECFACRGTGKATRSKCEECDGQGEVTFSNDHNSYEIECKSCWGDGDILKAGGESHCGDCRGSGIRYGFDTQLLVGQLWFDPCYLKLIDSPETEIAFGDGMLLFRCADAVGAIMRMRPPMINQCAAQGEASHV